MIAGAFKLWRVQLASSASGDGRCVIGLEHTGELAFATQAPVNLAEFGLGLEKFLSSRRLCLSYSQFANCACQSVRTTNLM